MTPAAAAEILPGVRRVVLPIPFELSHVNVYLVREREGWLLVDSGIQTEGCFDALEAGCRANGIALDEIRTLVLTHMHPDHIGLARRVVELSGARLLMHEVELAYLNDVVAGGTWAQEGLRFGGVPGEFATKILCAVSAMRDIVRSLRPDTLLSGGEAIETESDELEVVWTPGHSPGHICLYARNSKALFSGDHILTDITPNISWAPGRDTLSDFLASLRKIAPYDIDLVLPAHGEPFDGHRKWIEETMRHHDERSAKILDGLSAGPRTAHHLVAAVWSGSFPPFQHYFAVFEVLAHLEHMRRHERVSYETAASGAALWRSAAA